jgi:hypothetical protein
VRSRRVKKLTEGAASALCFHCATLEHHPKLNVEIGLLAGFAVKAGGAG